MQMTAPHPLSPAQAEALAERLRLLSEPTRLRLLDLLEQGEASVGELTERLGCTQANVSKHLALLADAGVIHRRRDGLYCYYALADSSALQIRDAGWEWVCRHRRAQADELAAPSSAYIRRRSASTSAT